MALNLSKSIAHLASFCEPDLPQWGCPLCRTSLGREWTTYGLSNLESVLPAASALAKRHVAYGTMPEHYPVVGSAQLRTLERELGDAWTKEVADAWTAAYAPAT